MSLSEFGIKANRFFQLRDGTGQLSFDTQRVTEIRVRLCCSGLYFHRLTILNNCPIDITHLLQRRTQRKVSIEETRIDLESFSKRSYSGLFVALFQKLQSVLVMLLCLAC